MKELLVVLLPLFFLTVQFSVISGRCCCEEPSIVDKDNNISPDQKECNPLPPTVITATPKKVIDFADTGIQGLIADGNYVFVAGETDKSVHKYDIEGNFIEKFSVPTDGFPTFFEIYDNNLYVTGSYETIFFKSVDGSDPFKAFVTVVSNNYAIMSFRFTPDGSHFALTSAYVIRVYNSQSLELVTTITSPSSYARVIQFDSDGNLYVSSFSSEIHKYDKNFKFIETINYSGAGVIDGWIFQCDGSQILADRMGRVIFADKDDDVVKIHTAGYSDIMDVTIAKNRALFVSDHTAKKLFIY